MIDRKCDGKSENFVAEERKENVHRQGFLKSKRFRKRIGSNYDKGEWYDARKNNKEDKSQVERTTESKFKTRNTRKERERSETNIRFYYMWRIGPNHLNRPAPYEYHQKSSSESSSETKE